MLFVTYIKNVLLYNTVFAKKFTPLQQEIMPRQERNKKNHRNEYPVSTLNCVCLSMHICSRGWPFVWDAHAAHKCTGSKMV